jgi:N-acetylneuraminic acid mutarotase
MRQARARHTAALLSDGRVLVAGGTPYDEALASTEIFDPSTNAWSTTGQLITGRYQHSTATLPDGTVMVAGGVDQSSEGLGSAELFTP